MVIDMNFNIGFMNIWSLNRLALLLVLQFACFCFGLRIGFPSLFSVWPLF